MATLREWGPHRITCPGFNGLSPLTTVSIYGVPMSTAPLKVLFMILIPGFPRPEDVYLDYNDGRNQIFEIYDPEVAKSEISSSTQKTELSSAAVTHGETVLTLLVAVMATLAF